MCRSSRERLAHDVLAHPHAGAVRHVRVLRAPRGAPADGQPQALQPARGAHRLQPAADRLQRVDILRGESDYLFFFYFTTSFSE